MHDILIESSSWTYVDTALWLISPFSHPDTVNGVAKIPDPLYRITWNIANQYGPISIFLAWNNNFFGPSSTAISVRLSCFLFWERLSLVSSVSI